jgi:hypothetical protein
MDILFVGVALFFFREAFLGGKPGSKSLGKQRNRDACIFYILYNCLRSLDEREDEELHSWTVDGQQRLKFTDENQEKWGSEWNEGDVIGKITLTTWMKSKIQIILAL